MDFAKKIRESEIWKLSRWYRNGKFHVCLIISWTCARRDSEIAYATHQLSYQKCAQIAPAHFRLDICCCFLTATDYLISIECFVQSQPFVSLRNSDFMASEWIIFFCLISYTIYNHFIHSFSVKQWVYSFELKWTETYRQIVRLWPTYKDISPFAWDRINIQCFLGLSFRINHSTFGYLSCCGIFAASYIHPSILYQIICSI